MYSKIEQININDMFDRAMSIRENTVITYIDLMTDKEIEIWNELNAAERVGIIFYNNVIQNIFIVLEMCYTIKYI